MDDKELQIQILREISTVPISVVRGSFYYAQEWKKLAADALKLAKQNNPNRKKLESMHLKLICIRNKQ